MQLENIFISVAAYAFAQMAERKHARQFRVWRLTVGNDHDFFDYTDAIRFRYPTIQYDHTSSSLLTIFWLLCSLHSTDLVVQDKNTHTLAQKTGSFVDSVFFFWWTRWQPSATSFGWKSFVWTGRHIEMNNLIILWDLISRFSSEFQSIVSLNKSISSVDRNDSKVFMIFVVNGVRGYCDSCGRAAGAGLTTKRFHNKYTLHILHSVCFSFCPWLNLEITPNENVVVISLCFAFLRCVRSVGYILHGSRCIGEPFPFHLDVRMFSIHVRRRNTTVLPQQQTQQSDTITSKQTNAFKTFTQNYLWIFQLWPFSAATATTYATQ